MNSLQALLQWFAGNGKYMVLTHCMGHDTFWIATTVILDFAVAAGYVVIAFHWWSNARLLPRVPAKAALGQMRNIFIFCGICGYLFIPIKMVWPAWRLYDMFLAVLVFTTWRYALQARNLKVVYSAIGKNTQLQQDLDNVRELSMRKSMFLNAISHDLRTPLNGLALNTSLAEMCTDDPEQLALALAQIRASTRAAAEMLDGLLEFATIDAWEVNNDITEFDLVDLLIEIESQHIDDAAKKSLKFSRSCPPSVRVRTDRFKLSRIVDCLVANAVRFATEGSVRIAVQQSPPSADQKLGGVEIHIIDTGPGISQKDQLSLFDDFYQIGNRERNRDKGVGLGLSIARTLARQLEGDLLLSSELGAGSRFSIVLPPANRNSATENDAATKPLPVRSLAAAGN